MKKLNELFNDKEKKKLKPLIFLSCICILGLIAIYLMPQNKKQTDVSTDVKVQNLTEEKVKEDLESKLTKILSKINKAGDVDVMITFESSEEIVPAYNSNITTETTKEQDSSGGERTTTSSTENKTMITSNSNEPVVLKTSEAKIKGVIVVASGASDPTVKELLYDAVKTSLQISGHQVEIYEK
ncbi:stage III sporulation protein AG [Terrisporobacter sp.]